MMVKQETLDHLHLPSVLVHLWSVDVMETVIKTKVLKKHVGLQKQIYCCFTGLSSGGDSAVSLFSSVGFVLLWVSLLFHMRVRY